MQEIVHPWFRTVGSWVLIAGLVAGVALMNMGGILSWIGPAIMVVSGIAYLTTGEEGEQQDRTKV